MKYTLDFVVHDAYYKRDREVEIELDVEEIPRPNGVTDLLAEKRRILISITEPGITLPAETYEWQTRVRIEKGHETARGNQQVRVADKLQQYAQGFTSDTQYMRTRLHEMSILSR